MMPTSEYIIGIDLGTTNSIVACMRNPLQDREPSEIHIFQIPQLTGPGVISRQDILPSFLLIPDAAELSPEALQLPWNRENNMVVGEFARDRGSEIPNRLIASAKSWLCHPLVDRNARILPWQGSNDALKRSPVEASAAILKHIVDAWNHEMAMTADGIDDRLRMEFQDILLTVPASFDAVARELTVKAAEMAGIRSLTLLEEPQAAFYAWIDTYGDNWRRTVRKGDRILVCDIGGGTSDFSLIQVGETDGDLTLERIAVGNHLLVGGDNMDLALGYAVAGNMAQKNIRLDARQMKILSQACRKGKETILSEEKPDDYVITILGRGRGLIAGTIQSSLTPETVNQVLLDGFFPVCQWTDPVSTRQSIGLQEMGLSYESDPAITRHLATFLRQNSETEDRPLLPTAVLFNGGVMKSRALRTRVLTCLKSWADATGGASIRELPGIDPDRSVARGAARYGLVRRGRGIRIRSGLNKTYYIGIAASMPAVPGMPQPVKALCVAPFGMEEGSRQAIEDREFGLIVGETARFDFLGSVIRKTDQAGEIVESWEDDIDPVTNMETALDGRAGDMIPVTLETRATETGTLEIWCISRLDDRQWRLEFNVREMETE
ncbi:MAG: Hsp70 family protein [Desulfatirhabdiaceae bacterium]